MQQLIEIVAGIASTPLGGASVKLNALQVLTFLFLTRPDLIDSTKYVEACKHAHAGRRHRRSTCVVEPDRPGRYVACIQGSWSCYQQRRQLAHRNTSLHAWGIAVRKLQFRTPAVPPPSCSALY